MANVKTRVVLNCVRSQSNLDKDSRLAIEDLDAVCAPVNWEIVLITSMPLIKGWQLQSLNQKANHHLR